MAVTMIYNYRLLEFLDHFQKQKVLLLVLEHIDACYNLSFYNVQSNMSFFLLGGDQVLSPGTLGEWKHVG